MLHHDQLVSLSNFAIYWDSNTFMFDHHKEQAMRKTLEEMVRTLVLSKRTHAHNTPARHDCCC
jgi:hypothetical protein